MAIKVVFPTGAASITVAGLYQWDYGQTLEIECPEIGSEIVEVHFACTKPYRYWFVHHCGPSRTPVPTRLHLFDNRLCQFTDKFQFIINSNINNFLPKFSQKY